MCCPTKGGPIYHSLVSNVNSNNTSQRNHLGLWKSTDAGATWSLIQTINHETSAYSDLIYIPASRSFHCTFERCRDVSTFQAFAGEISRKLFTKKWADLPQVRMASFPFNEDSSGAIPTTGRPLICHGNIDGGGWGGAGASYSATGAVTNGTSNGIFLQLVQTGANAGGGYANQRGGPWDWPAGEAITLQLIGIKTVSGSNPALGKTIIGNRDSGNGTGWQINSAGSGSLTATAFDGRGTDASGSSGTGSTVKASGTAALNGTRRTMALTISADRTRVRWWKEAADGTFSAGTAADWSLLTKGITGSVSTLIGNQLSSPSDTFVASTGEAVDIYEVRIEHGIERDSGFTAFASLVKESPAAFINAPTAPSIPANDPTLIGSGLQSWLLATRDNGYNAKVDPYGRLPAYMPRQKGSGVLSYADMIASSRVFTVSSTSRGLHYDTDSMVGPCYRMQYSSGAHASGYMIAPAIGIADWQLTMAFSFAGIFWFNSETGSSQVILDSCLGGNLHAGVWLARVNSTGKIQLIISKDGTNTSAYAFVDSAVGNVTINTGKPIFLGLKCAGSGKVRVAYGEYVTPGVAPTLTFTDSSGNITTGGSPIASDLALYVGDSHNTNAAADLRVAKNLLFYNAALADADFQSLASFGAQY